MIFNAHLAGKIVNYPFVIVIYFSCDT